MLDSFRAKRRITLTEQVEKLFKSMGNQSVFLGQGGLPVLCRWKQGCSFPQETPGPKTEVSDSDQPWGFPWKPAEESRKTSREQEGQQEMETCPQILAPSLGVERICVAGVPTALAGLCSA